MIGRRKGERTLPRDYLYQPYGAGHVVARAIASGSQWFEAWAFQYALNGPRLAKLTGIRPDRADQLWRGAAITRPELEGLAAACGVQPSDIIASLPDPALLLEE